jgi:hypothetical protein
MVDEQRIAWQRIAADTFVTRGPILLWGAMLYSSVDCLATLYEGANTSGRRITSLYVDATTHFTDRFLLPKPILLEDGLYVDVSVAPDDLILFYEHVPE